MKKGLIFVIVLMFTVSWAFAEKGAPIQYDPANYPAPERQGGNTVATATVISVLPYNDFGTTSGYSNNYDEVCPYTGSTSPDVVYSFTPTGDITNGFVSLCGNTDYDSKLYIYENAVTPGTPFACNDDACSSALYPNYVSELTGLTFAAGNIYYIVIDGYGGASGNYELDFTGDIANDNCATATAIGEVTDLPFNTSLATASGFGAYVYSKDLWYVFTAPSDGTIYVGTCGSSYDTAIALYGECDVATIIAYNDDSCGLQSELTNISVVSGEDYYIQVGGYGSYSGYGYLDLAFTPAPPVIAVNPTSMDEYLNVGEISTQVLNIANNGTAESLSFNLSHDYITDNESTAPRNYGDYADRSRISSSEINLTSRHPASMRREFTDNRAAGDVLGTYTGMPINTGLVWVEDLLYVVDYGYNQLAVYDISTQSVIASYPIHGSPYGITWDGIYLWIGDYTGNVYAYNLDGSSAGFSFSIPELNYPAITWDGSYFIVAAAWSMTNIYRVDETGAVINTYVNSAYYLDEICWVPEHTDGHIWATTEWPNIMQINLNDGSGAAEMVSQFDPPTWDSWPYSIDHHNFNLWWSDMDGPLYEIDDGIMEGWLSYDISSGILAPGENIDVTVTFDATEIYGGTYLAEMVVSCNDPVTPQITVPITLEVTGIPNIETDVTSIDFGTLPYPASTDAGLLVLNTGTDWLNVTDIVSDNPDFTVDITSFSVYAMEQQAIVVTFTPTSAGAITGDLTIYSNDPDEPELVVALNGVCTAAEIVVDPTSMSEALFVNEIATQVLTIENTGDEELIFEISEQNVTTDRTSGYYTELERRSENYSRKRISEKITQNSLAKTTEGLNLPANPVIENSRSGAILNEWAPAGGVLPWGINWTNEPIIWLTDPSNGYPTIFGHDPLDGSSIRSIPATWFGSWIGDMAYDWNHNLIWAVNVGGDYNIYGLDPITGDVLATLGGDFAYTSARGVAYDNNTDTFWIGSWNYGEIYHVAGLDWAIPGETIETIPFSGVSGLAFHENANVLAVVPNTSTEYIYLVDASTGSIIDQYDPPANASYGGAGIEFDEAGELWVVRQNTSMVYQVEFSDLLGPRGASDVSWLSEDITSGSVLPGESVDITVTFDATDMYGGTYQAELIIENNDPDNLDLTVPVTLDVTGIPNIAVDPVSIDFGAHYVGAVNEEVLTIFSTGSDDLEITDIVSDNPDFYCDVTTYTISPEQSEEVIVNFNPSTVGIITGVLTVYSNDPNDPEVYIDLVGEGLDAPEIVITPASFDINIAPDVIVDNTLTIENTGVVDVTYDISIEFMIPTDRERNYGDYADRSTEVSSDMNLPSRQSTSMRQGFSDNRAAGDILGTYTGMPTSNTGMVWVGDLLYIVEYFANQIAVYDISTQSVIATYPIHGSPFGITWDGMYLWVGDGAGNVYAYNLDGSSAGLSFSCPIVNFPTLTWNGEYFLTSPAFYIDPTIYKVDETGAVIDTYVGAIGLEVDQILWVPEHTSGNLWLISWPYTTIAQLDLTDTDGTYAMVSSFTAPSGESYAIGHRNFNLWWSGWAGPLYEIDDGIAEFSWLTIDITSGTLSTGQSDDITLTVDANEVDSLGVYEASLVIVSNDPDDPVVYVPVTLTVNYPPEILLPDDFTFDEDDGLMVDFDVYITDPNSSPYVLSVYGNTNITVDIVGSEVTFGAAPNWNGTETLTFTVDDGQIDTDIVDIIVTPVNDDPTIVLPDDFTFDEDDELIVDFSEFVDDIDLDVLTLTVTGNTEITVDIVDLEVTFGATENWNGTETLTFTVDDGQGERVSFTTGRRNSQQKKESNIENSRATAEDVVDVIVLPVNDDPTIVLPDDFTFDEDEELIVDFSEFVDDIDLDVLTLTVTGNTEITVSIDELEVTFGATENWNGTETLTFTVDDGQGERVSFTTGRRNSQQKKESNIENSRATAEDVVDVIVLPVNDDPTIVLPDDFTFEEDDGLVVDFTEFVDDVDPDDLTLTVTGNTEITVEIVGFEVTFGATENWNGTETLTFIIDDNVTRATAEDDVDVIVTPVNDEPVLIGFLPEELAFTVVEDSTVTFSVDVEDIDSTVEYEWYVDEVLQTEVTEEFVYIFEVVGDIAIKSVAFDEEYDIETIWIVEVEAGSGMGNELIPVITHLNQNYPNPFNPTTTISFDVKENETGNLRIYNMKGQLVFTKPFGTGQHKFLWDAASCSSGIYFYNLKTSSYSHTRKMILLK